MTVVRMRSLAAFPVSDVAERIEKAAAGRLGKRSCAPDFTAAMR
jgi:hypothetical protein